MVKVTFVKADGSERTIDVPAGESVMRSAIQNDIDEILGDCGGALSCATCHVHVAPEWIERTGKASSEERVMLEMAVDPDESSRLSCQIMIDESMEGLVLTLPKSQL